MNPEALLVMQSDAEGNGYSPLAGAEECLYSAETTYSGFTVDKEDVEADLVDAENAVVFWPIN